MFFNIKLKSLHVPNLSNAVSELYIHVDKFPAIFKHKFISMLNNENSLKILNIVTQVFHDSKWDCTDASIIRKFQAFVVPSVSVYECYWTDVGVSLQCLYHVPLSQLFAAYCLLPLSIFYISLPTLCMQDKISLIIQTNIKQTKVSSLYTHSQMKKRTIFVSLCIRITYSMFYQSTANEINR